MGTLVELQIEADVKHRTYLNKKICEYQQKIDELNERICSNKQWLQDREDNAN